MLIKLSQTDLKAIIYARFKATGRQPSQITFDTIPTSDPDDENDEETEVTIEFEDLESILGKPE